MVFVVPGSRLEGVFSRFFEQRFPSTAETNVAGDALVVLTYADVRGRYRARVVRLTRRRRAAQRRRGAGASGRVGPGGRHRGPGRHAGAAARLVAADNVVVVTVAVVVIVTAGVVVVVVVIVTVICERENNIRYRL